MARFRQQSLILLACLVLVGSLGFSGEADKVTAEQARHWIAKGKNLQEIPKSVWRQLLNSEQYQVMWRAGTEKAFSGQWLDNKKTGVYVTAGCRLPVFHSRHKYDSGTGWPSFWDVFDRDNIVLKRDWSLGIPRMEVLSKCGEHLGHVFNDGPEPTGLRYCINSAALDFVDDGPVAINSPVHNSVDSGSSAHTEREAANLTDVVE